MFGPCRSRLGLIAASVIALAVPVVGFASPAAAASGNSANAHACQKGGWQDWVRADGTSFANQGDCVSYAAQGGVLTTPVTKSASQLDCESYGGTFTVGSGTVLWTCSDLPEMTGYLWFLRFIDLGNHCIADGGTTYSTDAGSPETGTCSA